MNVRHASGANDLDAALALRLEVFCDEQGVRVEAEQDGLDDVARHLVAVEGGQVVGTCRLLERDGSVIVQRVAVRRERRRTGVGAALLAAAERDARERGAKMLELHAQSESEAFYRDAGYMSYGARFFEEGIEHVAMRLVLDDPRD
jgi:predicted GNAT family N-acyltransferase